ncbi:MULTISPECIES: response regulator transcription factor [unclassified Cupriavidus]|uniref:response regulator transcription factor n=1 Tax=unclassified Cupriavidus TaxID=2640874 RepID=UPI0010F91F7B|nr:MULTISPECIES: response regulator [unclassified Cupriavidus]MWL89218.1 response regulator [Cupriavidus sp. SW-Y-13]
MATKQVVAIVDDDESIRTATSRLVRSLGWEVHTYPCAKAFLAADATSVTCIVSDVQMPEMSGIEMLRLLKAQGSTVPVIFITAFCTESIRREALRAGALAFLCKPVNGAEIQRHLDAVAAHAVGADASQPPRA